MVTQSNNRPERIKMGLKAWREQNKLRLQAATLAALIGLSFGLYWALRVGQHTLAAVIFAIIALCMAFVIWIA